VGVSGLGSELVAMCNIVYSVVAIWLNTNWIDSVHTSAAFGCRAHTSGRRAVMSHKCKNFKICSLSVLKDKI
jgi:hypothetical protein